MDAVTLNLDPILHLTPDLFRELCRENRDIRLELTAKGELRLMPPTGWATGRRNATIAGLLGTWNRQDRNGLAFDSSTGFIFANGAVLSPDAAWVATERIVALNPDPEGFLPLAPDFVLELRSASDLLKPLQDKMQEYMDNGVRLGWLINPQDRTVAIYRGAKEIEVLQSPKSLSGEDVLPGFVLKLDEVFE